jgi:hypothetical protein
LSLCDSPSNWCESRLLAFSYLFSFSNAYNGLMSLRSVIAAMRNCGSNFKTYRTC